MDERSSANAGGGSIKITDARGDASAHRRGFEDLVSSISSSFVGAKSDEIDAAIHVALGQVADFIGTDRAYVIEFSDDQTAFSCSHDWCRSGIASSRHKYAQVPTTSFRWGMSRLLSGSDVYVSSIEALPNEAQAERAAMLVEGIHSFLTLPLSTSEGVVGAIGLDWMRGAADWRDEYVPLLRIVGQLIVFASVRVRSERRLAESEARHRTLMSQSSDAVVCFELVEPVPIALAREEIFTRLLGARLVECNDVFARHRGAQGGALLRGKTLSELAWAPRARLVALCDELIAGGFHFDEVESTLVDMRGVEVAVRVRGHGVVEDGMLRMLWGMFTDISERKEAEARRALLEEELQQARRLEAMGMLTGGIAHDFNNLLAVILSCTQLAQRRVTSQPEQAEHYLRHAHEAGVRAASLTRQLLAFSRRQPMQRRWVDLTELVRGLSALLRRLIRTSIQLEIDLPTERIGVIGDPSQLEQVLINLCVNAGDAISDVGTVRIRVEQLDGSGPNAPDAMIEVSDTGVGIPEAVQRRIFEPFYTTKAPGKGTGVGLAVVKNIVEQHNGQVSLSSASNEGAVFRVRLPSAPPPAMANGVAALPNARGGSETILLAEDDQLMRKVVRDLLAGAGYTVIEATNGAEAIRLFEENSTGIGLAVVDVMMPRVTGRAVFEQIRARWPNARFLFTTGYVSGVVPDAFFDGGDRPVLFKPYDSDTLLRKVREVIDAGAQRGDGSAEQQPQ